MGNSEYGSVLGELSDFGLKEAAFTNIFGAPADVKPPDNINASEINEIEKGIYLKTFLCPVCGTESKTPAVRSSSVRLVQTDSDFMPVYKDPNPLYYYAVLCKHCGFAAIPSTEKTITAKQKSLIREKISTKWKFDRQYPAYYNPETAIEIHKLALYNAVVAGEREGIKSIVCLHIAWLYRILKDDENEKIFLLMARDGLERAYSAESEPIGALDISSQQYLVGELMKRTGNMAGALNWFKLVLIDRDAKDKIKEMARNQKDKITAFYASGGKSQ